MSILNRIIREPAALIGFVTLALAGGSIFGWWSLSNAQFEWLLALLGALILVLRQYVTPVDSPVLPISTIVNADSDHPGIVVPLEEREGLIRPAPPAAP